MKITIFTALLISIIIGLYAKPEFNFAKPRVVLLEHTDRSVETRLGDRESDQSEDPDPTPTPKRAMAQILPSQEEIASKVRGAFTEDPETAVAVFRAESGLRANAMGWNCHYYTADNKRYSAACKPEDRAQAWSVDCGVAQINTPGNSCPEHLFDVETNLAAAYKKYVARGWQPWVAHKMGRHLAFLQ